MLYEGIIRPDLVAAVLYVLYLDRPWRRVRTDSKLPCPTVS